VPHQPQHVLQHALHHQHLLVPLLLSVPQSALHLPPVPQLLHALQLVAWPKLLQPAPQGVELEWPQLAPQDADMQWLQLLQHALQDAELEWPQLAPQDADMQWLQLLQPALQDVELEWLQAVPQDAWELVVWVVWVVLSEQWEEDLLVPQEDWSWDLKAFQDHQDKWDQWDHQDHQE